jgi:glutamyl-tRNA synthetase
MACTSSSPTSDYRGRLAPSPTGYLHVGHARTFWTAFERAREAGGTLAMRMEDLDAERSRAEFAEAAIEDLHWLGIGWQEGPDLGGPYAPYVQSQRRGLYLAAWQKLRRGGYLYACRCSRKDIESALAAPHERATNETRGSNFEILDDEPLYPGTCRPGPCSHPSGREPKIPGATAAEIENPDDANWRFRVPDGEAIEFVDGNLGPQRFMAGQDFGDFVVWRRGGGPSYQLACVVDDAAMRVTEVVRGADLIKSTARQILLNRALGFENPAWYHCRLVTDDHGRRLAKRHDALSLRALRERGLTPSDVLRAELSIAP